MQIISPDLLVDMRELPLPALAVVAGLGLAIWSTGWWTHRFWIALGATVTAGVIGLKYGNQIGLQPVVAGLLAAVGAGCVGLALGRIVIFAVYGVACWYLVHVVGPQFEVPLACFLIGGMVSVLCYRLCVMVLTSAVGALLLAYGGMVLVEQFVRFDAVRLVTENPAHVVNLVFAGVVGLGLGAQQFAGKVKAWWDKRRQAWAEFQKKQQGSKGPAPKGGLGQFIGKLTKAA